MKEALLKLQIESLEEQIKVLKSKILTAKKGRTLTDLYGIFEGEIADLSLEEIKKYEYSYENKV